MIVQSRWQRVQNWFLYRIAAALPDTVILVEAQDRRRRVDMADYMAFRRYQPGDRVRKIKGAQWQGRVVGFYSTDLTPEGYAIESERERGSVQIYPLAALEPVPSDKGGAHG